MFLLEIWWIKSSVETRQDSIRSVLQDTLHFCGSEESVYFYYEHLARKDLGNIHSLSRYITADSSKSFIYYIEENGEGTGRLSGEPRVYG